MELTPGYKKTEVGIIPSEWKVQSLRACLSVAPDYGINAPAVPFSDRYPTYVRITDISEDGWFTPHPRVSVSHPAAPDYYLEDGDLVFARTGASVGKSYRYDPRDGRLVFAGFLIRVSPSSNKLLTQFLADYVRTYRYWNWVRLMSMRSGQPGINGLEYGQLPIPVPPLPEQRAIAEVLGDVDELIGALEGLIAKKRDLKQAVMQQLLTGKTRLPGFHEDWELKKVSQLGDVITGGTPATQISQYWGGDIPWVTPTDISGEKNIWETDRQITVRGLNSIRELPPNTVLVTCIASIGKNAVLRRRGACNQQINAVVPNDDNDANFLYYMFDESKQYLLSNAGITATHIISKKNFSELSFRLPPIAEQMAIAAVLSDMDTEISALEQRRDKTRGLKQGMMQELLTGKTRLI